MLRTSSSSDLTNVGGTRLRFLWFREAQAFTSADRGSAAQRCRSHDLYGISGDVCREDPEAALPLFVAIYVWFCIWYRVGELWLASGNIWPLETSKSLVA
jgi:hypothetical protein